jgi:predicted DNA-binding transcriptional regulator AlpA
MLTDDSVTILDSHEAAVYLNCSAALVGLMRREGRGPKWYRVGKRLVRYRKADLDTWLGEKCGSPSPPPFERSERPPVQE